MPDDCVFCRIIRGEESATVVNRCDGALAVVRRLTEVIEQLRAELRGYDLEAFEQQAAELADLRASLSAAEDARDDAQRERDALRAELVGWAELATVELTDAGRAGAGPRARLLVWDWREQPDMDQLATALTDLSGGRLHMAEADTGDDCHPGVPAARGGHHARRVAAPAPAPGRPWTVGPLAYPGGE